MLRVLLLWPAVLSACGGGAFPPSEEVFAEALARFDKSGDGTLSREELAAYDPLPDTFGRMDSNADGSVDVGEFTYYIHANQPRALVSRKGEGPR